MDMTNPRSSALAVAILSLALAAPTGAFVSLSCSSPSKANPLSAYVDASVDSMTAPPSSKVSSLNSPSTATLDTVTLGTLHGLGTIAWSAAKPSDRIELEKLVKQGLQHPSGLLLDTAERYGTNLKTAIGLGWGETERLTRKLLAQQSTATSTTATAATTTGTSKPVIATKFTPSPWRTTVQSVVDACQESRLRLLGPDSDEPLDLYQLHMPDIVQPLTKLLGQKANPKDTVYWDGIAECYHRGLVSNVGVCNYGPTLLMQCQEHLAKRGVPLASNQIAYSILGRHNGAQATLDKGKELGIETLAFFPFAMGLLTGKYNLKATSKDLQSSLQSSKRSRLESNDLYRYALGDGDSIPKGGISKLLSVMEDIAQDRDKTVAQVALNYIICQGGIPIPGARTEVQFVDNMGAMGWRLTDAELGRIEEESEKLGFGFEGAGFKRTSEKFVGYGVEKWTLE